MTLTSISLLSVDEYTTYKDLIKPISARWWLKSIEPHWRTFVYCVACNSKSEGFLTHFPHHRIEAVRPLCGFKTNSADKEFWVKDQSLVGRVFSFGGFDWTVLYVKDGTLYTLCDGVIGNYRFDETSNIWETSELKFLLETKGLKQIQE